MACDGLLQEVHVGYRQLKEAKKLRMDLILKRTAMAMLVSFGIVGLWAPFHFYSAETANREVVNLDFLGYADDPDSPIPDLATAPRISEADMAAFPTFQETLAKSIPPSLIESETTLTYEGVRTKSLNKAMRAVRTPFFIHVDQKVADAFADRFFGGSPAEFAFVYLGHFFRVRYDNAELMKTLSAMERGKDTGKSFGRVTLRCETPVKVVPSDTGRLLTTDALAKWPVVQEALEGQFPEDIRSDTEEKLVPLSDWIRMIGSIDGPMRIVYKGRFFNAEPGFDCYQKKTPVMIQANGLRILGAVALILGLIAGRGLYRQALTPGISVCSPTTILAMDAIFVVFLGLCWVPIVDFLLMRILGSEPIVDEAQFYLMSVVCAILVTPILGMYITALSVQRVIVDANGIRVRSNLSDESFPWDKLTEIRTSDFYVPVGRVGMLLPRRAARVLRLEGDGGSATILEPSTKSGKHRIITAMLQHAPEALHKRIQEAGENWLG